MRKQTPGPWTIYSRLDDKNFHLISAAPDLLEACELALASDDRAVKEILRAAIAKAKGEKA